MAVRQIIFDISPTSILPYRPLPAGYVGDHMATEMEMHLAPALTDDDYVYHIEAVLQDGSLDTTGLMPTEPIIVVPVVNGWTTQAGIVQVTIVISRVSDSMVAYTAAAKLEVKAQAGSYEAVGQVKTYLADYLAQVQGAVDKAIKDTETATGAAVKDASAAASDARAAAAEAREAVYDIDGQRRRDNG